MRAFNPGPAAGRLTIRFGMARDRTIRATHVPLLVSLVASLGALPMAAAPLVGQGGGRAPVLLRQLYGDVAVEVRQAPNQAVYVGAAGGQRTVALTLLARDLRRWADSATRVLARRVPRATRIGEWRATVEGPGLQAGAMTLTRKVDGKNTIISVFIASDQFEGVRLPLTSAEARAFVGAMRRVAATVLAPPRKPPAGRRGREPAAPEPTA